MGVIRSAAASVWLPLVAVGISVAQEPSAADRFYDRIDAARAEYRQAVAEEIRNATEVEILLLRFDDVAYAEGGYDATVAGYGQDSRSEGADADQRFPIAPYGATTSVLAKKRLPAKRCQALLDALAMQIERPRHTGGALCHFPVHGLRVFGEGDATGQSGDLPLIYSGTFCWLCENFGFAYPDGHGAEWLDTTDALRDAVEKFMPVPAAELQRFQEKYPPKRRAGRAERNAPAQ